MNNTHLVILAGGGGTRLWPLSTEGLPKQFLDILGCGKSLLQQTAERFEGLVPPENIWVATSAEYKDMIKEHLPQVPEKNILVEPCRRNTAPCICYVSWKIKKRNPKANVIITPSDHAIKDEKAFREAVKDCMEFSSETDSIVTLGIKPTHPETGYGYIKADLSYSSSRKKNIFRVDAFKEKPTKEIAEEYIKQHNYLWNSGIFIWKTSAILSAIESYLPEMHSLFSAIKESYGTVGEATAIADVFTRCRAISIDYGVMERADNVFVHSGDFGWSDIGTWGSLYQHSRKDKYANAKPAEGCYTYDTRNTIISLPKDKVAVISGLRDYIVVDTEDVLMICPRSEEQNIKKYIDEVKFNQGDMFS